MDVLDVELAVARVLQRALEDLVEPLVQRLSLPRGGGDRTGTTG